MRYVLFVSTLLILATGASAQTSETGAISGKVKDPSGAVVPGAVIDVTNTGTQQTRSFKSDANGQYAASLLPPGNYTVTASAASFQKKVVETVPVVVTETTVIDITLDLGEVTSQVEVSAAPALLQTTDATLGRVVDERAMVNLPLSNRNFTQILDLSTGVSVELPNAATLGKNQQNVSANGVRTSYNNYQNTGIYSNNIAENSAQGFGPQVGLAVPAPDTLEEFKVQTGQYDASSGRSAGANVDIVSKSGTNNFHGDVFEFLRNTDLNANDYFRNLAGQSRPVLDHNQYGFTFGGPIRKDKTFFFIGYQGTSERNGFSTFGSSTVLLPPITNNRSAAALGAEFGGKTGAFGGVAVASDGSNINPAALALLNFKLPNGSYVIPTPQIILPNGTGESSYSSPASYKENQFTLDLDQDLSPKDIVSRRFFYAVSPLNAPFAASLGGANVPGFGQSELDHNVMGVLSDNYQISPTTTNEASFGFIRFAGRRVVEVPVNNSDVGITPPTGLPQIPYISVSGLFTLSTQQALFREGTNDFVWKDMGSHRVGRHNLRIGGQYEFDPNNTILQTRGLGQMVFESFPDFLLGMSAAQNGSSFSNVFQSEAVAGQFEKGERYFAFSGFVADDFTVSKTLTLTLGLRYDFFSPPSDSEGRLSNFDPSLAVPVPPAGGTLAGLLLAANYTGPASPGVTQLTSNDIWRKDWRDLAPRLGFAWRAFGSDKIVVRGGYGIYYERNSDKYPLELIQNEPYTLTINQSGAANAGATFQNPFFPALPPLSAFPEFVPLTPTSSITLQSVSPNNFRNPYTQSYSLGTQYQIRQDMMLDVSYVGSKSTRIPIGVGYNQPLIASAADPVNGQTTTTVANVQQRRPYLGLSSSVTEWVPEQDGNYNSLQVGVTKRWRYGLQFQSSYTWSKAMDLSSSQGAGLSDLDASTLTGNQLTPNANYGPADYDRTNRYVLSFVYDTPALTGKPRFVRNVIGHWSASGILLLQSGSPFSVTDSRSGTIYGRSGYANCTGLPGETTGTVESRIDDFLSVAGFAPPTPLFNGTGFGDCGRNEFRGPDQRNLDFSLSKVFPLPIHEGWTLVFRSEFFNITNTPNFSNPAANLGTASTFGVITSMASNPRIIQFALKLNF